MLEIEIPSRELYDENRNEFIKVDGCILQLEHSLLSISKWESKWHKPFLNNKGLTNEEALDYIRCMTINKNVDPNVYYTLTNSMIEQVSKYIEDPMTATWFNDEKKSRNKEVITSELIYYWMTAFQIPFEVEKWHLNRLLTLIRICSVKQGKQKKMPKKEVMSRNKALNEARRAKMGTMG